MDNASDYGSEDSRFESWQTRRQLPFFEKNTYMNLDFWWKRYFQIELFYCGGYGE